MGWVYWGGKMRGDFFFGGSGTNERDEASRCDSLPLLGDEAKG